jgi:hypothetical protein
MCSVGAGGGGGARGGGQCAGAGPTGAPLAAAAPPAAPPALDARRRYCSLLLCAPLREQPHDDAPQAFDGMGATLRSTIQ